MSEAPAVKSKTKVHNAARLAEALGLGGSRWAKARWAGLVPDPDRAAGTWSGHVVDDLLARAEAIRAAVPDVLTRGELEDALGLDFGERRRSGGVLPGPDRGEFYSRETADALVADADALRARIPAQPLGAGRCADLLAELTGLAVAAEDIAALAEAGHTVVVDEYKGYDLYDVDRLKALPADAEGLGVLTDLVAERQAWIAGSITPEDAAAYLRWDRRDLARIAAERGMSAGRAGRYARTDIAALAGDEDLAERVRREQLLGPRQAAQHMEIRPTDFEYVTGAGWVSPVRYAVREVGVRKTVDVPLYAVGDLEDALAIPGVDWEAVRAVKAGEPSPLREHARKAISRAAVIHAFCDQLRREHEIEVWPHWVNPTDTWEIDWELREDGHPTVAEVKAALHAHPGAAQYATSVRLSTEVGEVIRWARAMLRPGAAVVLDTETTDLDGVVIEVAVVDAATGETLLDTLVDPAGVPVSPGARAVHGISDAELSGAPSWAEVYPQLMRAVGDRVVLAYNASFDRSVVHNTHAHAGLAGPLPPRWECLMEARSTRLRLWRWTALGGGHRALGDAIDAREVLQAIAAAGRPGGSRATR